MKKAILIMPLIIALILMTTACKTTEAPPQSRTIETSTTTTATTSDDPSTEPIPNVKSIALDDYEPEYDEEKFKIRPMETICQIAETFLSEYDIITFNREKVVNWYVGFCEESLGEAVKQEDETITVYSNTDEPNENADLQYLMMLAVVMNQFEDHAFWTDSQFYDDVYRDILSGQYLTFWLFFLPNYDSFGYDTAEAHYDSMTASGIEGEESCYYICFNGVYYTGNVNTICSLSDVNLYINAAGPDRPEAPNWFETMWTSRNTAE